MLLGRLPNPSCNVAARCAVEHHIAKGRQATLTPKQLAGWRSLQPMVVKQSAPQK